MNAAAKIGITVPTCDRSSSDGQLYGLMAAIRGFEESLLAMFDKGLLVGTTHTCLGQEATAVGVLSALDLTTDIVFSNHRGHGHFLAYCGQLERLYLEVMGKPDGVVGGRGGSQHLYHHNFYSNGVQGGITPVTAGMALAEKIRGRKAVAVVFLGDGTLGEGAVYESMNLASLWELPVLFVIENNHYAQSTPFQLQIAGAIGARPAAFDIETTEHKTTDVRLLREAATAAVDRIRGDSRPRCLIIEDYRLGPHSKGDDNRDESEIKAAWELDPLKVLAAELGGGSAEFGAASVAMVESAREKALAAPVYEA